MDQIDLINFKNKSAGLILDESSERCMKILGKPDEISDYYSEKDEVSHSQVSTN